jgi:hypothetical protein
MFFFNADKKSDKLLSPTSTIEEENPARFFADMYQTVLRHHERLILWRAWQNQVHQFATRAAVSSYPHQIQTFLFEQKSDWFCQASRQYQSRIPVANSALSQFIAGCHQNNPTFTAQTILKHLIEQADEAKKRATESENHLKGYSSLAAFSSTLIRLLIIKHPSFQLGQTLLVECNQQASTALHWPQQIRITDPDLISFYANLTGFILLTCEWWVQFSAGFLNYSMFSQLSTLWLTFDIPHAYREYEIVFMRQREQHHLLLQICCMLMTGYLLKSENDIPAYLFIVCLQSIIGKGLDLAHSYFQPANQPQPSSKNGMKMLCQWMSFFAGAWMFSQLKNSMDHLIFPPGPNELLQNSQLCNQSSTLCRQAALNVLGLDASASVQDIVLTAREKMRFFHPDRNTEIHAREIYEKVTHAKNILLRS